MPSSLSIKQAKFVKEYLKDGNATQACIRAGYKKANADVTGPRMLGNVGIAAAIAASRGALEVQAEQRLVATMDEIEQRLSQQLRGKDYEADIASIQKKLDRKERTIASLEQQAASGELDDRTRAQITIKIADLGDSIIQDEISLKHLRLDQQAESNKAAVTLAKLKGAFDSRRPTVDDPDALIDATLRSIIRSGRDPSDLLRSLSSKARDVQFTTLPIDRDAAVEDGPVETRRFPISRSSPKSLPEREEA